jgi:hypothetical protein
VIRRAIEALQGGGKRRGRPPKKPTAFAVVKKRAPIRHKHRVAGAEVMRRKKRLWMEAQRKAQAARIKAFWAQRRATKK